MAVMPRVEQPKIEIERKIGNTTYIVNGFFASQGVTVSKRIIRVLDKETKKSKIAKICENLRFYLTFDII